MVFLLENRRPYVGRQFSKCADVKDNLLNEQKL